MYTAFARSFPTLTDHCWHLRLCLFCWVKPCFQGMTVSALLWKQSSYTMWTYSFITCRKRKCCLRCVNLLLLVRHLGQLCPFSISVVLFYMLCIAEWAINFKYRDNRYMEAWLLWTHLPSVSAHGGGATVRCCSCNHTCCYCCWFSASLSLFWLYLNIVSRSYTVTEKKAVYFQTFLMNFLELFSTSVVFIDFLLIP